MDADKVKKAGDDLMQIGCGITALVFGLILVVVLVGTYLAH